MEHETPRPVVNVVIVEDDAGVRDILCASIAREPGLKLGAALSSVTEALEWLQAHQPDVLLTDLGLPDGSGIEIIRQCVSLYPQCDIMVITMFGDEKNVLASIDAGALGYILKDTGDLDVPRFIEDLRNGGSPMSPLVARKLLARHQVVAAPVPPPLGGVSPAGMAALTLRELESLDLIARGYTYAEVAKLLGVSMGTVQTHVKHIYHKLSVHSRSEAVFEAHKLGLFRPGLRTPGGGD